MRVNRRKSSVLRNGQKWCKESLFNLMEDGVPAHRAPSTKKWHANHGVKLFGGWPGISPNLNPIENLWSEMKNLQRKRGANDVGGPIKNRPQGMESRHCRIPPQALCFDAAKNAGRL